MSPRPWFLAVALGALLMPARGHALEGAWTNAEIEPVLAKTLRLRLDPNLEHLSPGEATAVSKLLSVGEIFQDLYELSKHHQAHAARAMIDEQVAPHQRDYATQLRDLYRLFRGPIAVTLENERVPFLPVDPVTPGKNVYPLGLGKAALETYLDQHPHQRDELLHLRSLVREVTAENLAQDLAVLTKYPALDTLHPGLRARWEKLATDAGDVRYYGVPYSVAYAEPIQQAYRLLHEAADAVHDVDRPLARFLRARARDLLADDYDGGDAAWITGRFQNINAQIGSYETYDDEIYGVKSFFSLSLLLRDRARSDEMMTAIGDLQALENSLPYDAQKRVSSDIPVGVYDVVADFGQARGTNTATILPNESHLARQYGRTILLRTNIMRHPMLFQESLRSFQAAVVDEHHQDLDIDGNFYRTLWHEIGHYLGVDRTQDGETLDAALAEFSDVFEEMKADLVSLFSVQHHLSTGAYDETRARSVYAGGIRRVLQKRPPRRSQAYGTMQLMQWNYYLDQGLLEFEDGRLRIHYDRYHDAVGQLLKEVLAIQYIGDPAAAAAFVDRWATWDDDRHGVIAARMRGSERFRYRLVTYSALGE